VAYATAEDLADYLGEQPPPDNAATLLDRASTYVDDILIGAYYQTDTNGNPVDEDVAEALRKATCAQVLYWAETGNTSGTETGDGGWRDMTIGNVRLSRSSGGSSQTGAAATFAPDALRHLRLAGLLPIAAWVYG
jgi:hypothetical protein